ncbi:MAG TPA: hypothetical protein VHC49_19420 [Mycobacteriales bacterium]|nr:hypothetical protein [Mycobacteriales bacterium]
MISIELERFDVGGSLVRLTADPPLDEWIKQFDGLGSHLFGSTPPTTVDNTEYEPAGAGVRHPGDTKTEM